MIIFSNNWTNETIKKSLQSELPIHQLHIVIRSIVWGGHSHTHARIDSRNHRLTPTPLFAHTHTHTRAPKSRTHIVSLRSGLLIAVCLFAIDIAADFVIPKNVRAARGLFSSFMKNNFVLLLLLLLWLFCFISSSIITSSLYLVNATRAHSCFNNPYALFTHCFPIRNKYLGIETMV